jgi:hypothetical protein
MVAAGGTVASAAVFHLPVLGFGVSNAAASSSPAARVATVHPQAPRAVPRRVVKTRFVDDIVHRRAHGSGVSSVPGSTAGLQAGAVVSPPTAGNDPMADPPPTSVVDPPDAPRQGDDGHENDGGQDHEDHGDHEDHDGQSTDGIETGQ